MKVSIRSKRLATICAETWAALPAEVRDRLALTDLLITDRLPTWAKDRVADDPIVSATPHTALCIHCENQKHVVFLDACKLRHKSQDEVMSTIAHELAHVWQGLSDSPYLTDPLSLLACERDANHIARSWGFDETDPDYIIASPVTIPGAIAEER